MDIVHVQVVLAQHIQQQLAVVVVLQHHMFVHQVNQQQQLIHVIALVEQPLLVLVEQELANVQMDRSMLQKVVRYQVQHLPQL